MNHVENSEWIASPAEKVLNDLLRREDLSRILLATMILYEIEYKNIVAVVDPPRGGLHRDVIMYIYFYSNEQVVL